MINKIHVRFISLNFNFAEVNNFISTKIIFIQNSYQMAQKTFSYLLSDDTTVELTERIKDAPEFIKGITAWLINLFDTSPEGADIIRVLLLVLIVIIIAVLANYLAKGVILSVVKAVVKRSKTNWDDIILEKKVFNNLSHIAPALAIYFLVDFAIIGFPDWISFIQSLVYIYFTIIAILVLFSFFDAINAIYQTMQAAKNRSIMAYLQVIKVLVVIIAGILIISVFFDKSPMKILAGLGVFVTALMFLFKDSLLGLVGGIQLSAQDMVRPGDWISMPSRGADGTVMEITLNTVKVQNWDKTISTVPTYSMMTESFKNWRGMEESGGRRICRNINIDLKSIKFCDDQMLNKFAQIQYIKEYIDNTKTELQNWNKEENVDNSNLVNGRRMTNIGTFRHYIESYLRNNSNIHQGDMTLLIRQLDPTENGLPIQIYVFCKVQAWVEFEAIQSDIFDHIFAIIPEFNLRIFQNPTGDDFRKLVK